MNLEKSGKSSLIRKTVAGATLSLIAPIAAAQTKAPATSGSQLGGKSQVGVSHLSIDMFPDTNATICYNPAEQFNVAAGGLPANISLVVNPNATAATKVNFTVGDILPSSRSNLMILIYGKRTTPSPEILTPKSHFPLKISFADLELFGIYNLPALKTESQAPTRIGQANPTPRGKYSFSVNLDNSKLPAMLRDGDSNIYVQAAVISPEDLNRGEFGNMLLSDIKNIQLIANACSTAQSSVAADSFGGKTIQRPNSTTGTLTSTKTSTNSGTTTKTK